MRAPRQRSCWRALTRRGAYFRSFCPAAPARRLPRPESRSSTIPVTTERAGAGRPRPSWMRRLRLRMQGQRFVAETSRAVEDARV